MEKLLMCRICLTDNYGRLHLVIDKELHEIYEKLTGIPFVTEDNRPHHACFSCCTKLKKYFSLQKKCLEANEMFAHMKHESFEPKPLLNNTQRLESIEHTSIVYNPQIESITIKDELPDDCDDIIVPKKENQRDDLEPQNVQPHPPHSESHSGSYNVPLVRFKIEVDEELEILKNEERAVETSADVKPENIHPHPPDSESGSTSTSVSEVPIMKFKIEVEEEQEVSNNKRKAVETSKPRRSRKKRLWPSAPRRKYRKKRKIDVL